MEHSRIGVRNFHSSLLEPIPNETLRFSKPISIGRDECLEPDFVIEQS